MKTLVLCRHAKSDWPLHVQDIDRPLKDRGEQDAKRLGKLLLKHDFMPDLICSSPANRAQSTAEIIKKRLGYQGNLRVDRSIYFQGAESLLNFIADLDDSHETVMIFGHNPTMEHLVAYLADMKGNYEMPTCGMACFESYTGSWKKFASSSPRLRWLMVPRLARTDV
ncbi:MAG: histidine phosphatase family protein [Bacteroidia bacterium]